MKKWISGLTALLLALTLSACSPAQPALPASEEPVQTAEATTAPSAQESPAAAEETPVPEESAEADAASEFARGTWADNVYTNSFADITVTLPQESDVWVVATDEELAQMMDIGADAMEDMNAFTKELVKLKTIQDMMVQNSENGSSLIVMFENLSLTPGGTDYSEEDYGAATAQGLAANTQLAYTVGDLFDMSINGQNYTVMPAVVEEYGMTQYYMLRRVDDFMAVIVVTAIGDENMTQALQLLGEVQ